MIARHLTPLALISTIVLWAAAFVGIRAGLKSYDPASLALLRFLIASTALLMYALLTRMPLPDRRDLPAIGFCGAVGITLYNLLLNWGEQTVAAGPTALLVSTTPVWSAIFASLLLGEPIPPLIWLGIGVSFVGAALIALGQGDGFGLEPAVLLILVAAMSQALFFVRQVPLLGRYAPFQLTTYVVWSATILLLPFGWQLPEALSGASREATLAVVFLGLGPAVMGYLCWAFVLSRLPAARATNFLNLIPIVTFVIGWLWLGESPTLLSIVGGACAILGIAIVNAGRRRTRATAAPPVLTEATLPD